MMNSTLDLDTIFDTISETTQNDFKIRNVMVHRPEKGRSIEEVLRTFLTKYFPKSLGISYF
jgi:hypothetical protein